MKIVHVKLMPKDIESDTLYVSKEYGTSRHLCPCGCANEIVIPFNEIGNYNWNLKEKDGKITLHPSIGNHYLACKSHYYIVDNQIVWC